MHASPTGLQEGDLIKGAFNRSSVGTLVERKTRFVVLCKMDGNTAAAALDAFSRQMKRLPREMRRSSLSELDGYVSGMPKVIFTLFRAECVEQGSHASP